MKSTRELIDEGLLNENSNFSRTWVAQFYKKQLIKFDKIGVGKETENGVTVTESLIKITEHRLNQVSPLGKYMIRERNERRK